ncbi:hypothetical protein A9G17_00530 [Gilliamella sp. wkB7]|uniref:phage tail-collar fiber domain-containing protein n=1 Tax=Gilliamella sp. wkB7 TaxID=3120264 RepID=UPI000810DEE2|nr:phage tail protein [Gilliamella apicola]OCF91707.1 hypothetical protein A9G17_00530 [Gilliamella apicola]
MSQKFYTLITQQGAALLANATTLGIPLKLSKMAVGDANGSATTPDASQTKLIHEVYKAPLNTLTTDEKNPNQIIAELVIPENQGGWFINEIGLYDEDDTLVAVGNCPTTYKPKLSEGSGRTQVIRMIIVVDNVNAVTLKFDPSVVLATRQYVENLITSKMANHEQTTNHPSATTNSKGFVQLNSAIDSNLENQAATPLAVKKAYNLAIDAAKKAYNLATDAIKKANDLISAHEKSTNHPNATTNSKGFVQLNSAIDSNLENQAATPLAVKKAYNLAVDAAKKANDLISAHEKSTNHPNATTNSKGFVQLNSAIDSNLENQAATPLAVKKAYNLVTDAIKKTNDLISAHEKSTNHPNATTKSKGFVQLNSSIDSTIENQAATPKAVRDTYEYARVVDNKAITAHEHANNAHNRISETNNALSNITDRLKYLNDRSQLSTANKRYVFVIQDDAAAGVFDVVNDKFVWSFNNDGLCAGYVDSSRVGGLDQFVKDRTTPVGVPMPWPQVHPPTGYFECNGAEFDKNQFQKLAAAYPSGKLPDLRGEFIRGWDNTRGSDPSRMILSWQQDTIRNIYGNVWPISETFGHHGGTGDGAFRAFSKMAKGTPTSTDEGGAGGFSFDASRVVPVAHENRPRNVAFMYIVKAE